MRAAIKPALNAVGAALFALMFLTFLVQIIARFGFDRPLPWTDELAVILYIWVILWAAAFMVPARDHVVFDLIYNALGSRGRRVLRMTVALLIGGLFLTALPASLDYVGFMGREGTPVLGWPLSFVYLPFVLMLAVIGLRSLRAVWIELRGHAVE